MTHRIRTFLLTVLGLSALVPALAWAAPSIEAITLSENAASRASAASAPTIDAPVTAAASSDQFLTLTATAAKALNTALGTRLFSAGLKLGTASTLLRF